MCASRFARAGRRLALAAPFLAVGSVALAGHPGGDSLQVHGFVSQGFVLSEGNNVNGTSQDSSGSLRYQEFGVNSSWRPHADLLLSGQVASVRAGEAVDEYLLLEYGLIDWTPYQSERGRAGVRMGKIKLPIGFYNDSRDAVSTRPSIFLPESIYLENSGGRSFGYFSAIGGAVYSDWFVGDHSIYLEAGGYGKQDLRDNANVPILRTASADGNFEVDKGALLRIADDYDGGRFRAAVSYLDTTLHYNASGEPFDFTPPDTNLFAQDGDLEFEQTVLSLQYNWPSFSLTGEYVWREFKLDELIPQPFPASTASELEPSGAYVQGTWRVTPKFSGFLRYDEQIRDSGDRSGREQSARFGQPRYYFFAFDWAAGTRYDLTPSLALLAEFHYVEGAAWLNPLDNPEAFTPGTTEPAERYWNFFTVMLGYRF